MVEYGSVIKQCLSGYVAYIVDKSTPMLDPNGAGTVEPAKVTAGPDYVMCDLGLPPVTVGIVPNDSIKSATYCDMTG